MLNALRRGVGFALKDLEARTGLGRGAIAGKLESARERGWVEVGHGRVVPTELGRRFTNDVISLFL
jgi:oxygen-independent coproporphyrinogen-3 oxidase